jgi:Tol biopolymer transport system component
MIRLADKTMRGEDRMSNVRLAMIGAIALTVVVGAGVAASSAAPSLSAAGLPAFAPDEPLVLTGYVTGAGGGIFVKRPDGTGGWQLGTDVLPGVHKRGSWSPDGQQVVFIDQTTERMWIAHLDGSPTTSMAACDAPGCDFPAWSPDGTRIAFSRYENGAAVGPAAVGVYVVDLASGEVSPVVRLERPLLADVPRWSPDGTRIVFGVDQMNDQADETGAAIAVVPASGGEPQYLTPFDSFAYNPDWGWATGEIVFDNDFDPSGDTSDIFGIEPDGSGLRQITAANPGEGIKGARWTPDGTGISAYDGQLPGGILIDPRNGSHTPFITTEYESRPQVRPTP